MQFPRCVLASLLGCRKVSSFGLNLKAAFHELKIRLRYMNKASLQGLLCSTPPPNLDTLLVWQCAGEAPPLGPLAKHRPWQNSRNEAEHACKSSSPEWFYPSQACPQWQPHRIRADHQATASRASHTRRPVPPPLAHQHKGMKQATLFKKPLDEEFCGGNFSKMSITWRARPSISFTKFATLSRWPASLEHLQCRIGCISSLFLSSPHPPIPSTAVNRLELQDRRLHQQLSSEPLQLKASAISDHFLAEVPLLQLILSVLAFPSGLQGAHVRSSCTRHVAKPVRLRFEAGLDCRTSEDNRRLDGNAFYQIFVQNV
nr:hypothetical protein Iba_chr09eCG4940 [Ipomoea batatas]